MAIDISIRLHTLDFNSAPSSIIINNISPSRPHPNVSL